MHTGIPAHSQTCKLIKCACVKTEILALIMNPDHLIDETYISRHRLLAGNMKAPVAVCALWKDLSKVSFAASDLEVVALVGNLYTARGISFLLRGLWLAPGIRHLVLWGPDTQHTGRALAALWSDGLGPDHQIADTDTALDPALPAEAIEHLRQQVFLYDYRSARELAALMERIRALESFPPHGSPRIFPAAEPEPPQTLPSAGSGWQARGTTVAETWPHLLDLVVRFGVVKESQYGIPQRELLNILAVVTDENPDSPHLPEYLPLSQESLRSYIPSIIEDAPADEMSYTYGNRLRGYFGLDQVDAMVERLRQAPYSRRAMATLWDPHSDPDRDTPPCLTQVVLSVVNGRLFLTYTARSQDIFAAWPQNTLAMRMLQARVANALGLTLGPLTSHTVSAHLYQHDWKQAEEVLEERRRAQQALQFDPQGNFLVRVESGQILVELLDPGGQQVLWQAHGTDARILGNEIAALRLASEPAHYVYLGRELRSAELALLNGEAYVQDRA
jgi:thymidylate synthase